MNIATRPLYVPSDLHDFHQWLSAKAVFCIAEARGHRRFGHSMRRSGHIGTFKDHMRVARRYLRMARHYRSQLI